MAEFGLLGGQIRTVRSFEKNQRTFRADVEAVFGAGVDAVALVANPRCGAAIITEWAAEAWAGSGT